jgi:hypothetical protein
MTISPELEKIEALRSDFEYIDGDTDGVIMTVGFVGSFYFWGGHTVAKRIALVECFEAYEAAFGSHFKWGWEPDNAAIRPLRNGKYRSMGSGSIDGELRFTRCTSDLWIRRFDGPGIWPPASFADLPSGPVGTRPAKKIRIGTGESCNVHGRYRKYPLEPAQPGDGDDNIRGPMIVLLPGDLAPFHVTLGPHGEFVSREATTWELVAEL